VIATTTWLTANRPEFGMSQGRLGFAHLRHYTAEYRELGDGPPLIVIPGLAGGYRLLGPVINQLAKHFRVISYHMRGEDDCFALRRSFAMSDLVDDLEEFVDWLNIGSTSVFGVSFGGVIGLEFAARYPERVNQLVVQGVGARFDPGLIQKIAGMVLTRFPLPTDSPFVNQFFNLLFGAKTNSKSLFHFVTKQCWRTDQSVMAHRFKMVESFDMSERLHRVQAPSLLLSGDRDLLVSSSSLETLYLGLPECRLVRLKGAGHLGFVSQPQRVANEVSGFIQNPQ